ncbi:MAG: type II secretion system protein [Bacteroidia bacterium]|nr:type II secretion system protein [Bacteroidia bacterium]
MQIGKILKGRCRNNKGFTLIEVIAVLVILAIVSAVAISRATGTSEAKLQAEVDTLKGHLRYAQYLAMNDIYTSDATAPGYATRTQWGINITGTTSYNLVKYVGGASVAHTFTLPGDSSATHTFESPVTAMVTTALVLFDEWGSPYSDTATKLPGTSSITIATLNPGGQAITIIPETGFIP